jgi:hypothetical protein
MGAGTLGADGIDAGGAADWTGGGTITGAGVLDEDDGPLVTDGCTEESSLRAAACALRMCRVMAWWLTIGAGAAGVLEVGASAGVVSELGAATGAGAGTT